MWNRLCLKSADKLRLFFPFTLVSSSTAPDSRGEAKWLRGRRGVYKEDDTRWQLGPISLNTSSRSLGRATQHVTLTAALSHCKCSSDHGWEAATQSTGQERRCLCHYQQLSLKQTRLIEGSLRYCRLACAPIKWSNEALKLFHFWVLYWF